MNKYAKLISNTVLFAVGSFSSKILTFLLVPLYTHVLTPEEYGISDMIVQMSNLLLPIASAGILNSIIRFGLDKSVRKSDVFTTGLTTILCGATALLLLSPLLNELSAFQSHALLACVYVMTSTLRSLCSEFVRAKEYVRLYAIDGVLATLTVILFNLLFLTVFRWGIVGYVLATSVSDLCSVIFLFAVARLWRSIRFRRGTRRVALEMFRYGLPLVPTTISWWLTNMYSRVVIVDRLGEAANGLFSVAYKLPSVVTIISNLFLNAWQMSAVTDGQGEDRADFFSKVYEAFSAIVFLCASGIITFSKVIVFVLVGGKESYYPAWQYVPLLVMGMSFSCLVTFLGSVYMVEKRSVMALVTTLTGAGISVALCNLLVPVPALGVNGANIAMLVSYLVVFLLRAVSAQRMIKMRWNIPKLILNIVLLSLQAAFLLLEVPLWMLWEALLTAASLALNLRPILRQLSRLIRRRSRRRA